MVTITDPVPEVNVKSELASNVSAAKVVAPSAFKVEVVDIAPSEVIAPIPVNAPVVDISQSDESMATVAVLLPMVVTPVDERVVVVTPVAPVIAPAPEISIEAVFRKLSKLAPILIAVCVEASAASIERLIPYIMSVPAVPPEARSI